MTLLVAALCDAATDYGGKLNILGTFDTIFAAKLPVIHPYCAVALRMSFNKTEEGRHDVRVDVVNDDGAPIGPPMQVPLLVEVPDEIEAVSRNVIVNIQNWQFNAAGNFALNVSVDGRHEISIPLRVVVAQNQSPAGPASPDEPQDSGEPEWDDDDYDDNFDEDGSDESGEGEYDDENEEDSQGEFDFDDDGEDEDTGSGADGPDRPGGPNH